MSPPSYVRLWGGRGDLMGTLEIPHGPRGYRAVDGWTQRLVPMGIRHKIKGSRIRLGPSPVAIFRGSRSPTVRTVRRVCSLSWLFPRVVAEGRGSGHTHTVLRRRYPTQSEGEVGWQLYSMCVRAGLGAGLGLTGTWGAGEAGEAGMGGLSAGGPAARRGLGEKNGKGDAATGARDGAA